MDALWFGCVPVIISDRYVLPLRNLLNWDDIAYRIPESQVSMCVWYACVVCLNSQIIEPNSFHVPSIYFPNRAVIVYFITC